MSDFVFEVDTPMGFRVRCSSEYWAFIVKEKHPVMAGHEKDVAEVLRDPDEIRRSRKDPNVYLFYRGTAPRWLCAVTKDEGTGAGFLITTYPTDSIKAGDTIWKKSK